jgi:hypothetical protein
MKWETMTGEESSSDVLTKSVCSLAGGVAVDRGVGVGVEAATEGVEVGVEAVMQAKNKMNKM